MNKIHKPKRKNMFYSFLVVSYELLMQMIMALPRYPLCNWLKATFLRMCGAKIGKRVVIYPGVWIVPAKGLELGDDVDIALGVIITIGGNVKIGDRTLVGYRTQIIASNHIVPSQKNRIFSAGHISKPVIIANDVWIGANCIILPGVTIGEGAVVAAGAVVTKDIPAFSYAGGVPARVLKMRE